MSYYTVRRDPVRAWTGGTIISNKYETTSSRTNFSLLTFLAYPSFSVYQPLRVASSQRCMSRLLILLETISSVFSRWSRAPASSSDFPPVFHFISRHRHFRLQRYLLTISKTRGPLPYHFSTIFILHPFPPTRTRFLSFPRDFPRNSRPRRLPTTNSPICIFHLLSLPESSCVSRSDFLTAPRPESPVQSGFSVVLTTRRSVPYLLSRLSTISLSLSLFIRVP